MDLKLDKNALKNIDAFFNALTSKEQKRILLSAYKKGAKPMVDTAKNLVPFKTGMLYNSIAVETIRGDEAALQFGIKYGGIWAGWYGQWLNDGTRERYWKHKSKKYVGRIRADNFIKDAYDWNEDNFVNISELELNKYITKQIIKYTKV
jgi:HK97 gp10 family phage protein